MPISEHVLALIFTFGRQLHSYARNQSNRLWQRDRSGRAFELEGQTLAVIGLGAIGETLAKKASSLGLSVVGVRRRATAETFPGISRVYPVEQIDEALAQADHVAICLPLTAATRDLFSADRIARLKPGAFIYNIGRGPIINPDALLNALTSGHLGGAGLDVTSPEPLPAESPLWSHPNVIITPHVSAASSKTADRTFTIVRENIARALRGESLRNVIDKINGY